MLAEHLNDDRLGRVLDALYLGGLSQLFVVICQVAARKFGIEGKSAHSTQPRSQWRESIYRNCQGLRGLPPFPLPLLMAIRVTVVLT